MDVKEKLVEWINQGVEIYSDGYQRKLTAANTIADHLIAHGVTVQEWDCCKYCKGEFIGENPIATFENDSGIESIVEDEFLYNYCDCGIESVVKINFCPMCGRKLPQPPEFDK